MEVELAETGAQEARAAISGGEGGRAGVVLSTGVGGAVSGGTWGTVGGFTGLVIRAAGVHGDPRIGMGEPKPRDEARGRCSCLLPGGLVMKGMGLPRASWPHPASPETTRYMLAFGGGGVTKSFFKAPSPPTPVGCREARVPSRCILLFPSLGCPAPGGRDVDGKGMGLPRGCSPAASNGGEADVAELNGSPTAGECFRCAALIAWSKPAAATALVNNGAQAGFSGTPPSGSCPPGGVVVGLLASTVLLLVLVACNGGAAACAAVSSCPFLGGCAKRERGIAAELSGDRKCVRRANDLKFGGMPMGVAFRIGGGGLEMYGVWMGVRPIISSEDTELGVRLNMGLICTERAGFCAMPSSTTRA